MIKQQLFYSGKSKEIYMTDIPNNIIIHFRDNVTAFNGIKKANIKNKGIINNGISAIIFQELNKKKIPTHFLEKLNKREQLCKKVDILPLEVIVRNVAAGNMAKKLGLNEGTVLPNVILEIRYQDARLGDPFINDHHAVALGICTYEDLAKIYDLSKQINMFLKQLFDDLNIILVDLKIEFGKDENDQIILADEISPDTMRLWDKTTFQKLDKDRFRRDLGKIEEAYIEILNRLKTLGE